MRFGIGAVVILIAGLAMMIYLCAVGWRLCDEQPRRAPRYFVGGRRPGRRSVIRPRTALRTSEAPLTATRKQTAAARIAGPGGAP